MARATNCFQDRPFGHRMVARAKSPVDVFLYVPNLIGYFRIVATLAAFVIADQCGPEQWVRPSGLLGLSRLLQVSVMGLYITSFAADLLDGKAARYFDQLQLRHLAGMHLYICAFSQANLPIICHPLEKLYSTIFQPQDETILKSIKSVWC